MNQAQHIQKERAIEKLLESERTVFEQFTHRRYLAERDAGTMVLDSVQPLNIHNLCWRNDEGVYGVDRIAMSWLGWKARAMYQIVMDQAEPVWGAPDAAV